MSRLDQPQLQPLVDALAGCLLPHGGGLTAKDAVVVCELKGLHATIQLQLGYPVEREMASLREAITAALASKGYAADVDISVFVPKVQPANNQNAVKGVKNILAVASGKGGVGKSTTSANIALALAAAGAKVGMLDADIYGPSQGLMLGIAGQRPDMYQPNMMEPITAVGGVKTVSMANLVTEDTPMVWRGPMVSGALQQLLNSTHWDDIDYLVVDMPPGTGDIQLTLSQSVPVSGSLIVTTPQDIALLDAVKGIEMFRKVHIPVLGVVENMATHQCSQCGYTEAIFGEHGGVQLAQKYQVEVLGRLPLKMSIREQTDQGTPPVFAEPDSEVSQIYRSIALRVAAELWRLTLSGPTGPTISLSDD